MARGGAREVKVMQELLTRQKKKLERGWKILDLFIKKGR